MFIPTLKKLSLPGMGTKGNSIFVVFKHEAYIKDENMKRGKAKNSYSNVHSCRCICRSSRPGVFCKKRALRNFTKFTRKHMYQSLFFNKKRRPESYNFIKKEALAQVFSCEFCEISKNTFSYRAPLAAASAYVFSVNFKIAQSSSLLCPLTHIFDM